MLAVGSALYGLALTILSDVTLTYVTDCYQDVRKRARFRKRLGLTCCTDRGGCARGSDFRLEHSCHRHRICTDSLDQRHWIVRYVRLRGMLECRGQFVNYSHVDIR